MFIASIKVHIGAYLLCLWLIVFVAFICAILRINTNILTLSQQEKQSTETSEAKPETQEEEEIDIDLNDPEVEKAAEKIQAGFKGFKARKEVQALKVGWSWGQRSFVWLSCTPITPSLYTFCTNLRSWMRSSSGRSWWPWPCGHGSSGNPDWSSCLSMIH